MSDIYLDPTTGDLSITEGKLRLTQTIPEDTRQRLSIKLRTYRGEWFLDLDAGLPYLQEILVKGNKTLADTLIKNKIRQDSGVAQLIDYVSSINNTTNTFIVSFRASTTDGTIIQVFDQVLV